MPISVPTNDRRGRARRVVVGLLLILGSSLIALGAVEVYLRLSAEPCRNCWGIVLGLPLPPFRVDLDPTDPDEWSGFTAGGIRPTRSDLRGVYRDDSLLGFAPQENAVSTNGWWQSNNIGARSRTDTPAASAPGTMRVVALGESFTNCSRVPQEDAWPRILDEARDDVEVVNLGVDGYSMGQAYLRWRTVARALEYDVALLTFVPREDLIREVNTLRELMGWELPIVVPRFRLENDELELIRGPYRSIAEMRRANERRIDTTLVSHLRRYDLLNDVGWFQSPPVVGHLVLYKIVRWMTHRNRIRQLLRPEGWADSEAERIASAIFLSMNTEVEDDGARFVLVYLPLLEDRRRFREEPAFRRIWSDLVRSTCPRPDVCIDLMEDFISLPEAELDLAIDGTHYGPHANRAIARILSQRLDGLLREGK